MHIDNDGNLCIAVANNINAILIYNISNIYYPTSISNVTSNYYDNYFTSSNAPISFLLNGDCVFYGSLSVVQLIDISNQYGVVVLDSLYKVSGINRLYKGTGFIVATNQPNVQGYNSLYSVLISQVGTDCPVKPLDPGIIALIALSPIMAIIVIAACVKAYKSTKFVSYTSN